MECVCDYVQLGIIWNEIILLVTLLAWAYTKARGFGPVLLTPS